MALRTKGMHVVGQLAGLLRRQWQAGMARDDDGSATSLPPGRLLLGSSYMIEGPWRLLVRWWPCKGNGKV